MSNWTEKRLNQLFRRYNRLYWSGKLPQYSVTIHAPNKDWLGHCEWEKSEIWMVVEGQSDRKIRQTMLHEMCHAATGHNREPHGYRFWAQVEMLLRKRAHIEVTNSEAPTVRLLSGSIPKRFPLSRALMERLERQRQRQVLRWGKGHPFHEISNDEIIKTFDDVEWGACLPWQKALQAIGREYGLHVEGKPKNSWARSIVEKGRKVHTKARRFYLLDEKLRSDPEFRDQQIAKEILKARRAGA